MKIEDKDFEALFGEPLSDYVKNKIAEYGFAHTPVTEEEREAALIKIIDTITDPSLVYSGPHRLKQWEEGWEQNLEEFTGTKKMDDISPHYFGKYEINRFSQSFVKATSKHYERNTMYVILDYVFDKYIRGVENIYEFGCGTGHTLVKAREINPSARLFGLDWAESSQKILKELVASNILNHTEGYHFDFFNMDDTIQIANNSAVYTVMALEQIGAEHKKFVSYLIKNKPHVCIHIEPIEELLDEKNLLDNLSIKYARKRSYLSGFLSHLRELESEGKIKIHEAKRSGLGNFFVENCSIVVWSPL